MDQYNGLVGPIVIVCLILGISFLNTVLKKRREASKGNSSNGGSGANNISETLSSKAKAIKGPAVAFAKPFLVVGRGIQWILAIGLGLWVLYWASSFVNFGDRYIQTGSEVTIVWDKDPNLVIGEQPNVRRGTGECLIVALDVARFDFDCWSRKDGGSVVKTEFRWDLDEKSQGTYLKEGMTSPGTFNLVRQSPTHMSGRLGGAYVLNMNLK